MSTPGPHALKPIDTILIATSLSDESETVVCAGVRLARRLGARPLLVHSQPLVPMTPGFGSDWVDHALIERQHEQTRQVLRAQAERSGMTEPELFGLRLDIGPPVAVILDAARDSGADLIVVGPHEGPTRPLLFLGSTAERVVRSATSPVLVVRGDLELGHAKVLAPVDFSDLSADSFRCELDFLQQLGADASIEIEALFVLELWQREQAPQFSPEQIDRLADEELHRFLGQHGCHYRGEVAARVRNGKPAEEILSEVDERGIDLVAIGTHGAGGFERLLIGGVALTVLREAPCSLLVIPPPTALGAALEEAVESQLDI